MTSIPDLRGLTDDQIRDLAASLPAPTVEVLLAETTNARALAQEVTDPLAQAIELDPGFVPRPHLQYIADRIAQAVCDVENGMSRFLLVETPPRVGKTTLCTIYTPLWVLRRHPEWSLALVSHESTLATSWGREIRRKIEATPDLGIMLAADAGAASEWETTDTGGVIARSVGGSLTGRGARVMVIDDPVKDFVTAHSEKSREAVWDWWRSVALNRLEPPSLVIVVMTLWHEDDFAGRLQSAEYEGDPADWEVIRIPALADSPNDPLGRAEGEPLLSPLIPDETPEQALARWETVRTNVGTYVFSAMHQQRPAPAKGSIFDIGWWRYWTRDPGKATDDGRIVYFDPGTEGVGGRWLDSWDMAFKDHDDSDYVVGQRWCKIAANRFLIAQQRGRWAFTATLTRMKAWGDGDGPHGGYVSERVVEDKANGTAVIDTLRDQITGLIPVNPTTSKEARARAVTPEIEAGNVYLPHPTDPGNEWVSDLLSELRNFPHAAHDDQVDALTQALMRYRGGDGGAVTVPGRQQPSGRQVRGITVPGRVGYPGGR